MPIRSPAHPRMCALICAKGCGSWREAGYEVRDHKQVHVRTGEALSVEILGVTSDPLGSERFSLFYKPALARLGIDVTRAKCRRCPI